MGIPYVNVPAIEVWQWLYLVVIGLSAMSLFVPIAVAERESDIPTWIIVPGILGILIGMTHWGLIFLFYLHLRLLASPAPIGASIVAFIFSVGCFHFWMKALFPRMPYLRKI